MSNNKMTLVRGYQNDELIFDRLFFTDSHAEALSKAKKWHPEMNTPGITLVASTYHPEHDNGALLRANLKSYY